MQNYVLSEEMDISNEEWKCIFLNENKNVFKKQQKNKNKHFLNMLTTVICGGWKTHNSTAKHTLECTNLLGGNELVTYIPDIEDLYGDNEEKQVYIARILKDNIRRLPE